MMILVCLLGIVQAVAGEDGRMKYNFNAQWLLHVGDVCEAKDVKFDDAAWKQVTLPRPFNEDEAFRLSIEQLTDTVVWYRKHFRLPSTARGKKVFVEFEGVRQGADFYLNGHHLGLHENGAMAVGFDLTPYINYKGNNVMAVRVDNDWDYKERATGTKYQWSDRNFNANYGGIPKNVWLHVTDKLYQTLPLYSNLKTTGVYVYAEDIRVKSHRAVIHAESEVRNEHAHARRVLYRVELVDRDGRMLKTFESSPVTVRPGERPGPVKAAASYLIVCALVIGFFWLSLLQVGVALDFGFVAQYHVRILDGLLLTVQIAVGQGSRILPVRYLCDVYVKLMRGTPLLAQIYLFFYIVGTAWGVENRLVAGIIILSIFSGAYIAEIVRGSLTSLDAGQLEAARAVGFTRRQTLRYVVVPQLVSRTLPALTGQLASMIKDSSLLSVIAVIELTQTMQEISSATFNLFGTYLFLAGAYLALTLPLMFVSRYFERRLDYAHAD